MTHLLPINDTQEHTEESTCKCSPSPIEQDGEIILIHNSFDGRELTEKGFQKGLHMNGIKTRDGQELIEADIIETIQGTKFYCVNYFGLRPHIIDQQQKVYPLEDYMSPNIWRIGNLFDNPEMRPLFLSATNASGGN